jgi:Flp pilus assembly protein TadB
MEFGDCLNRWTKVKGKEETFRDEMKVVMLSPSPVILASYIERYNLLFYLKRNIGFSFFCLAICSGVSCLFLRPILYFICVTLVSAFLGFVFACFARATYKDFLKRLESALELLEQGGKQ